MTAHSMRCVRCGERGTVTASYNEDGTPEDITHSDVDVDEVCDGQMVRIWEPMNLGSMSSGEPPR